MNAKQSKAPLMTRLTPRFAMSKNPAFSFAAAVVVTALAYTIDPVHAADPPKQSQKGRLGDFIKKMREKNARSMKSETVYKPSKDRKNLKLETASSIGSPLSVEGFNKILRGELESLEKGTPGDPLSENQFIRRVYLDVIGQLPGPADVREFMEDGSPDKREKLVDRLLDMPQFGENWARYWTDAITYRNTAGKPREIPFEFETWMATQLNSNIGWNKIVSAILTANGTSEESPQGLLIAVHDMSPPDLAGETARLFLGVQISCAQCHDHPTDHWKRDQFHELAAFFGRTVVRREPMNLTSATIAEKRFNGEYRKPDLDDPSKPGTLVQPIFLTGQTPPAGADGLERRQALASFLTSPKNALFAKAFVNRLWTSMIGEPFTPAVDDLGAHAPAILPKSFDALSRSFASSKFDIKRLARTILLSDAYLRPIVAEGDADASGVSPSSRPVRLASTQIFDALTWTLGDLGASRSRLAIGPRADRFPTLANSVERLFGVDPSDNAAHVEGSIPQALLLMNAKEINARIKASDSQTILGKILKTHPKDVDAIQALYLRALARMPTEAEIGRCQSYISEVGNRGEAFEDIIWALINSTEYIYNH